MALTDRETEWLRSAAENSAVNRQLLTTHTEQISNLFGTQAVHAEAITVIGTKQDECQRRNDPGNKSERMSVWVAIVAATFSVLAWLVNVFK